MGLDSAFPGLSNKIGFIQFGSLNRPGLIFKTRYRSVFEIKWKMLNSNNWAAREAILGRPAKHSAYAGWLSGCPHASVRQGVRSGMGRCGAFDLVLIQRPRVIVDVGQRRRDRNLAASGGRWGLTGAQARVGEAGERRSRRRRTSWYRHLLLGRLQSLAPFFSSSGRLRRSAARLAPGTGWNDQ